MTVLNGIRKSVASKEKMLTVLIDPDKFLEPEADVFLRNLPQQVSFIFVGGSTVEQQKTEVTVEAIKAHSDLPVVLFPGDFSQISHAADGILFLSLISGRNPEYLIDQQVKAVPLLRNSNLEVIPTGYILINGGRESAVERVSGTKAISQLDTEIIVQTAVAGEYSGKKVIYLEAGSGAAYPIDAAIISEVKRAISIPLIVGGGIRSQQQLNNAYNAGADMVVIGTAFEEDSFSN